MKKNIVKFVFAIVALGGTAHAQITNPVTRQRATREMGRAMGETSSWIQFVSHEPQKSPMEGKKPTVAPVARNPQNMPRCITFEEFIAAMGDSTKWVKVPNPVMDTMPVKNRKTR